MPFDLECYRDEVLPQLLADPTLLQDPVLWLAVEPPVGTVPDKAHVTSVRAAWFDLADDPQYEDLMGLLIAAIGSLPVDDEDFWAQAWEDHGRRVGSVIPPPPPPPPPVGGTTPPPAPGGGGVAGAQAGADQRVATPVSTAQASARTAIDDGDLLQARRVLNSITVPMTEVELQEVATLRGTIDVRLAEVESCLEQAHQILNPESGHVRPADAERAGELLIRATSVNRQDERAVQALRLVATPAPNNLAARIEDRSVVLTWEPAKSRFGQIEYQVLRGPTSEPTLSALTAEVIGTTANLAYADEPDLGRAFRYGVVANRDNCSMSAVIEIPEPIVVTAEVGDLRLQYAAGVVRGSWRRPERCNRVLVTRLQVGEADAVDLLEGVRHDGFVDGQTESDLDYAYTVRCCYVVDGHEVVSPGRSVVVSPKDAPDPVEDIEGFVENDSYVLTWATPEVGEVVLRRLADRPTVQTGDRIDVGTASDLGELVSESIEVDKPSSRVVIEVPSGQSWYLPVTTNGTAAVVGQVVMVDHLRPVGLLDAKRQGDDVVVSWVWPAGATDARVTAVYQGQTSYNRTISQAEMDREGGVYLPAGPEVVQIRVTALSSAARGRQQSSPATTTIPARRPTVFYEHERRGGQVVLRLQADRDCRVSQLVVVGQPQRTPTASHDGVEVTVLRELDLLAGEVQYEPIGKVKRSMKLACFAGPQDAVQVRFGRPQSYSSER